MAQISIIIPVFRAENFIQQCIYSLLEQTLSDIEIIAVDDCGGDKSIDIIENIKQEHKYGSKIKILKMQQNSGAAAARNFGQTCANGEYIAFVDADDWCESTMYANLYEQAKQCNADWCFGNATKVFENGKQKSLRQPPISNGEMTAEKRKFILTKYVALFWAGIYRRDFLSTNNIKFPQVKFSEDSYFVWQVVMHAQHVAMVDKTFYNYRMQQNSVSNIYDEKKVQCKIQIFQQLITDLRSKHLYENYKEELDFLYLKKGFLLPLVIYARSAKKPDTNEIRDICRNFCNFVADYKKNKYYKQNFKIQLLTDVFIKHPKTACLLVKMFLKNYGL